MYKHLPKVKRLNKVEKAEAQKMMKLRVNKTLLKEHLQRTAGKAVTLRDLTNLNNTNRTTSGSSVEQLIEFMLTLPGW